MSVAVRQPQLSERCRARSLADVPLPAFYRQVNTESPVKGQECCRRALLATEFLRVPQQVSGTSEQIIKCL